MNTPPSGGASRIVVGIDGSLSSGQALRWAVEEARLRGARLEVIYAWESRPGQVPSPDLQIQQHGQAVLDTAVAQLSAEENPPQIGTRPVNGHAAAVLIEASAGALLLVVGSRGHGGVAGALLGSVSQRVAAHAHCPVVIVR
ncbi:universal stress protein [Streptomyces sp. NPDC048385]|uniref:universal stress protein n=1 Tax=unclassified Streptomyces TaxID=2593676 RepID=UPI0034490C79